MMGALYILAINTAVGLLLALSFFLFFLYDRSRKAALWIAAAYLLGSLNFLAEFLTPLPVVPSRLAFVAAALFVVGALCLANIGLAEHYSMRAPYLAMGAIIIFTALHTMTLSYDSPDRLLSMLLYQMPMFMCQALGVGIVANAPMRDRLDEILMAVLACSCLQFLIKPMVSVALGGWGLHEDDYVSTAYALFSQAISIIFAVATALILIVVLLRELLRDLSRRSETDTLSGLLNRRGYELRVSRKMPRFRRAPVSIVVCDLDHFKVINDTFGHGVGDLVIVQFAELLRQAADDDSEVSRIGGEEFSVFLPGYDLEDAQRYCESVRELFAQAAPIPGMTNGRPTASFGIAQRKGFESLWEIIHNADKALYAAKRAGRNQIQVARYGHEDILNAAIG